MTADYEITMDSFGDDCPENWAEIADELNAVIASYIAELTTVDEDGVELLDEDTLREKIRALWEACCAAGGSVESLSQILNISHRTFAGIV